MLDVNEWNELVKRCYFAVLYWNEGCVKIKLKAIQEALTQNKE